MGLEHVEDKAIALVEVAVTSAEDKDLRVPRRCGDANLELEFEPVELGEPRRIDLQSAKVMRRDEIRELSRAEVAGPVLVSADRMLVP